MITKTVLTYYKGTKKMNTTNNKNEKNLYSTEKSISALLNTARKSGNSFKSSTVKNDGIYSIPNNIAGTPLLLRAIILFGKLSPDKDGLIRASVVKPVLDTIRKFTPSKPPLPANLKKDLPAFYAIGEKVFSDYSGDKGNGFTGYLAGNFSNMIRNHIRSQIETGAVISYKIDG